MKSESHLPPSGLSELRRFALGLFGPCLLALGPGAANAETRRVPQDYATIAEALEGAQPCDRVEVGPGTYQELLWVPHGVRLVATGSAGETVIDGGGVDEVGSPVPEVVGLANGAVLQGFTVRNAFAGVGIHGNWHEVLDCVFEDVDVGIEAQWATAWLRGNRVEGARSKGLEGVGSGLWIDDFTVRDTPIGIDLVDSWGGRILRPVTERVGRGLFLRECNLWVAGGRFEQGDVGAVISLGNVQLAANVFAENLVGAQLLEGEVAVFDNQFEGNGWGVVADFSSASVLDNLIVDSWIGGVSLGIGTDALVANNTIDDNPVGIESLAGEPALHNNLVRGGQEAIRLEGGAATLRNNVLVGQSVVSLHAAEAGVGTDIAYTAFFGAPLTAEGYAVAPEDVTADPLLDADGVPASGSPLLDAGDPDGAFSDLDNSRNDLGVTGGPWAEEIWDFADPAPPTIGKQPDQQWEEGGQFVVFLNNVADPNDDPLRISWDVDDSDGLDYCDGFSNGVDVVVPDEGDFAVWVRVQDSEGYEVFAEIPYSGLNLDPEVVWDAPGGLTEGREAPLYIAASDPGPQDAFEVFVDVGDDGEFEFEDGESGFYFWTPPDDGALPVRVVVRDEDGGSVEDVKLLSVQNLPPELLNRPPAELLDGANLDFDLQWSDPSPTDTVTASLLDGPDGMVLDGANLRWSPEGDYTTHEYVLRLQDEDGGVADYELTIAGGFGPDDLGEGCACSAGQGGGGWLLLGLFGLRLRRRGPGPRA